MGKPKDSEGNTRYDPATIDGVCRKHEHTQGYQCNKKCAYSGPNTTELVLINFVHIVERITGIVVSEYDPDSSYG
ncbi:hypothetical protein GCM10009066_18020 [Halarchaeum salinum]|uniref:Uncharacterized protein n=1 Tax=Halarchaeum salinum TaxID=489912 RepID=A0AAV3S9B0_9EURY